MRSPSQRINILPADRIMTAGTMNTDQEMPCARAAPACIFRFIR